jgi:predicted RNase H-like HicB family nuclease
MTLAKATYRAILVPEDDGGFSVLVPALPGCYTQGDTRDEALHMAKEAIELHIESLRDHDEPIPNDEIQVESVAVDVSAA